MKRLLEIIRIVFFCITCCFYILLSIAMLLYFCVELKDSYAHDRALIGSILLPLSLVSIVFGFVWGLKKKQLRFALSALSLWIICIAYCTSIVVCPMAMGQLVAAAIYFLMPFPLLAICFFLLRSAWKRTADDNALRLALKHMLLLFAVGGITVGISYAIVMKIEIGRMIDWEGVAEALAPFFEHLQENSQ